jgi:diacylglycerol kinase (ATP)
VRQVARVQQARAQQQAWVQARVQQQAWVQARVQQQLAQAQQQLAQVQQRQACRLVRWLQSALASLPPRSLLAPLRPPRTTDRNGSAPRTPALYRAGRFTRPACSSFRIRRLRHHNPVVIGTRHHPMKNQPFRNRLGFALKGIVSAWRTEMSFRQQCIAALCVVAVLVWRRPAPMWWAFLLINCGLVLAAELFNSALEAALDHLHPERHPAIAIAKDCAAGAVLLLSVTGVCVFVAFLVDTF